MVLMTGSFIKIRSGTVGAKVSLDQILRHLSTPKRYRSFPLVREKERFSIL
jgi:hypothetical protein